MNKVILHGYMADDPDLKISGKGKNKKSFTVFRIGVNDYNDSDFFNCIAFDKTGDIILDKYNVGGEILIEGRLKNNNYEDKDGVKHYSNTIIVDKFDFCGKKE